MAHTLWEYEKKSGSDYKIDNEFERYRTFIIEISEWRDGVPDRRWHDTTTLRLWPIEERARPAFAILYRESSFATATSPSCSRGHCCV